MLSGNHLDNDACCGDVTAVERNNNAHSRSCLPATRLRVCHVNLIYIHIYIYIYVFVRVEITSYKQTGHLIQLVFYADSAIPLMLVTKYRWSSMQIGMPIYAVHLLHVVFYADLTSLLKLITHYLIISHCGRSTSK